MRSALGLPCGMVLVDRREALDSQCRPSMLVPLSKLVFPNLGCVMDELRRNTSMNAVGGCDRSSAFSTTVGVVQGRKLSPLAFCIGQVGFFTDDDNEGQSPAHTCSLCGLVTPENVNHLFVDCAASFEQHS